jgi:hypothetical protein
MEVLVALVIVSFVVTLLSQALFQAMRVEQQMDELQFDRLDRALREATLREALGGILPVPQGEAHRFQGRSQSLTALTNASPFAGERLVVGTVFEIVHAAEPGRMELRVRMDEADASRPDLAPAVLFSWPGRAGTFMYLDERGRWVDEWVPSAGPAAPALPRAVAVTTGATPGDVLIVPIIADPAPPPSRRYLESL